METEPVKTNVFGHILEVTLNRPKANAIDLKTSKVMGHNRSNFNEHGRLYFLSYAHDIL